MPVQFLPTVKVLKAAQIMNASTDAEWTASNPVLPPNMMAYASDTGVLKIGNGTSKWTELPVFYSQGMVDAVQHVKFVADIAARDALTGTDKAALIVVYDASADPTVDNAMAGYVWDEASSTWQKIFEKESMDVDLTGYFDKNKDTADSIKDGITNVVMLKTERDQLAELVTDAVRYSDTIVLQGTNAAETLSMLQAEAGAADAGA